jgi:hypothetical protein
MEPCGQKAHASGVPSCSSFFFFLSGVVLVEPEIWIGQGACPASNQKFTVSKKSTFLYLRASEATSLAVTVTLSYTTRKSASTATS